MNSTISQNRLIANRANAQKSTGPRTQAGKLRSRMNALKHGLRSPQPIRLPSDDPSFLDTFHQALFEELNPQTPLQLFHFEQLFNAACTIRRIQQLIGLSLYACTLSSEELKKRGIPSLPPAILDRYHRAAQTLFSRALKALQAPPEPPTAGLPTAGANEPIAPNEPNDLVSPTPTTTSENEPSAPNEPTEVTLKATESTHTQSPIAQLLAAGAPNEATEAALKATSPVPTQSPVAQLPTASATATESVPTQSPVAQLPTAGLLSARAAGAADSMTFHNFADDSYCAVDRMNHLSSGKFNQWPNP